MVPRQSTPNADRFSTASIIAGVVLALLCLASALLERDNLLPALAARAVPAVAFLAAGLGVAWVGSYLGVVLWRVNDLSRQLSSTAADRNAEMRQILDQLETLVAANKSTGTPVTPTGSDDGVDVPMAANVPEVLADPLPPVAPSAPCAPGTAMAASALGNPGLSDRVVELLEEIREVALMDDEQRRARLRHHRDARRRAGLDQALACMAGGRWAAADQALCALEVQFGDEPDVRHARAELQQQRAAAEADALFRTEQLARELVQVGSWERAIAATTEFVNNFPASRDGRHLLSEVYREHDAYQDTTFRQLYEQVQAKVDRREWRAALADAQRLLEQFPTHPRATRMRQQLRTIATNAEIEERQEHELRIQLLIRNRRFAEAVELAEEVVRRFPDSPQAEALEERLPQLRELAGHGESVGI